VVANAPVALSGTSVTATFTADVTPLQAGFGIWTTGSSPTQAVTVNNTGTAALSDFNISVSAGSPPFSRPAGLAGGTCPTNPAGTLAPATSCTIVVQFAPTAVGPFTGTLTVSATGATVSPSTVNLTGTGVAPATTSLTPGTLTITLPRLTNSGSGVVTLTNTAPSGGAQVIVGNVAVAATSPGSSLISWFFSLVSGGDSCTGATLAPGASCAVTVSFTNVNFLNSAPRGVNRSGTVVFTLAGAATPTSTGNLTGFATL
jgi:hypothetical protein